jgi:hypothetical protein
MSAKRAGPDSKMKPKGWQDATDSLVAALTKLYGLIDSLSLRWVATERMMRKQTYVVKLNRAERQQLSALTRRGKSSATVQLKARILLHADTGKLGSGWNDAQISEAL